MSESKAKLLISIILKQKILTARIFLYQYIMNSDAFKTWKGIVSCKGHKPAIREINWY